ncbi:MAG: hypothetical protein OHK0037_15990 [Elainellaceae cyanobacterium]
MAKKTPGSTAAIPVQTIVIIAILWAVFSLLFFLLFSVPLPGQGRPEWYGITTYFLENIAFLAASILCFRNWRSPLIVSGRTVWLLIGLGMLSFFIGNLILGQWEIGWGKSPDASPADLFFLLMYLLVGAGMFLAVSSRKLNLAIWQWLAVVGVGVLGIAIAWFIYNGAGVEPAAAWIDPPAIAQTAPEAAPVAPAQAPAAPAEPALAAAVSRVPGWAVALENTLSPMADTFAIAYVAGDIILLMAAMALLLAFWGGRFSLSWRFIAAAAISFYVADMWFLYATSYVEGYQTGGLLEVFWIFSACLFAIGAALEYDLSSRSRRGSRRRA